MSTDTIEVQTREGTGTLASKKLRQTGNVPAILYGHGESNVNLAVKGDKLNKLIHQGSKILSLTGAVNETALVKDVQWDAFGIDILHVDFTRVSQSEAVEVTLPIELQGEAPGIAQGGKLAFLLHDLTISCPANAVPESLSVSVADLKMGESIQAKDVTLPEGASVAGNELDVVVQVAIPSSMKGKGAGEDGDEAEEGSVEPEVIGKGPGEGDAEDAS
ncbi:MAG: 50S ribosomal protein L25 [Pirellulaceae bacterium]